MTEEEIQTLKSENERLKAENEQLKQELMEAKVNLRRAKNPSPVEKPSFKRVLRLVWDACMNLKKVAGGWLLTMGKLERKFKSLKLIWELLTQENWYLSDIFPPQKKPTAFKDAAPRLPKRYPHFTQKYLVPNLCEPGIPFI
jgi:hypothetical protein